MDHQQTYLLNGLVTRQFGLGRIARFRLVKRGRQAATYEVMTAQQHEYLLYLYPPTFRTEQLAFTAGVLNGLDRERFSVVPMVAGRSGDYVGEGPQGNHLMVSLVTSGSAIEPAAMTVHDISQVGLRLAWMHRLLKEHVELPDPGPPLVEQVDQALQSAPLEGLSEQGRLNLLSALRLPNAGEPGWAHGDIQADALLHDGDRQLRTVVDWALLHAGNPLEDIVDALWMLCGHPRGGLDQAKAAALLEAYDTLSPLRRAVWTAAVAQWAGQRVLDAAAGRRALPPRLAAIAAAPEQLAVVIASAF